MWGRRWVSENKKRKYQTFIKYEIHSRNFYCIDLDNVQSD